MCWLGFGKVYGIYMNSFCLFNIQHICTIYVVDKSVI